MTAAEKKTWSTPKLRVFVRTRMEERVLQGCKGDYLTPGDDFKHNRCRRLMPVQCQYDCSQITSS